MAGTGLNFGLGIKHNKGDKALALNNDNPELYVYVLRKIMTKDAGEAVNQIWTDVKQEQEVI